MSPNGLRVSLFSVLLIITAIIYQQCNCPIIMVHELGSWVSIGPEEILGTVYAPPNSGRATVIAVNPYNKNDVWLGTATGGLWHSLNITSPEYEWIPVIDSASSLSIGSILLEDCSIARCGTVWIGTGENSIRRDTYYGTGLLKLTWNASINDYTLSAIGDTQDRFRYGSIIAIKRFDGALYIALSNGKSASSSSTIITAPEPPACYGIHRSRDNGLTWEKVGVNPGGALPSDMEIQGASLLVGFHGAGIYRLCQEIFPLNAVDIWCPLGPTESRPSSCPDVSSGLPNPTVTLFDHVEIAVSPQNSAVIYAAYGQCESENYLCSANPLFFVSRDGGVSWESRTNNAEIRTYSRYMHVLKVDPQNDNRVYYGGLGLYRSDDSANNFVNQTGYGDYLHFDLHDLVFPDLNEPLLQYVATDGGIYIRDRRVGVQSTYPVNDGLETIQFYSISSDNSEGAPLLMGGTQDNGTAFFSGSPYWEGVLESDGGDCIIAAYGQYYASMYDISPHYADWLARDAFEDYSAGIDQSDPCLFTPPFLIHPITHDLYYGTNRLYKRNETDAQWIAISPHFDTPLTNLPGIERPNSISAVALSKANRNIVYVALYNGDVWISRESGPCLQNYCWKKIGGAGTNSSLPVSVPTSLEVDPNNENIAYITYSDFSDTPKVWRTLDRGETWQPFSEGLPSDLPIKVIRVKPDQNDVLYLGTDKGVYRRLLNGEFQIFCYRAGGFWRPYGPEYGMPNVPVYDIDFDTANRLVYAATHGRGVFMLPEEPVIFDRISESSLGQRQIYLFGYGFNKRQESLCSISFLDDDGKLLAQTSSDARGGIIKADKFGRLVSINKDKYGSTTMVIPLIQNDCVTSNKRDKEFGYADIAQLELRCGDQTVRKKIRRSAVIQNNPPSTLFRVRKLFDDASGHVYLTASAVGGQGQKYGNNSAEASTNIDARDNEETISQKLVDNFNLGAQKSSHGYHASVPSKKRRQKKGEDIQEARPFIRLDNKSLEATQIFTGFESEAGEANRLAFDIDSIGLSPRGELIQTKIAFTTLPEGSKGGSIVLIQQTPAGRCQVSIETKLGQKAELIARNLYSAIINMRFPGIRQCESRHNSYDVRLQDNNIITFSAIGISIEIRDSGVGVSVSPY